MSSQRMTDSMQSTAAECDIKFFFVTKSGTIDDASEDLKYSFQIMTDQYGSTTDNLRWISEADCLSFDCVTLTTENFFVLEEFAGKAFDHLSSTKAVVIGPRVLINCQSSNVPNISLPMNDEIFCSYKAVTVDWLVACIKAKRIVDPNDFTFNLQMSNSDSTQTAASRTAQWEDKRNVNLRGGSDGRTKCDKFEPKDVEDSTQIQRKMVYDEYKAAEENESSLTKRRRLEKATTPPLDPTDPPDVTEINDRKFIELPLELLRVIRQLGEDVSAIKRFLCNNIHGTPVGAPRSPTTSDGGSVPKCVQPFVDENHQPPPQPTTTQVNYQSFRNEGTKCFCMSKALEAELKEKIEKLGGTVCEDSSVFHQESCTHLICSKPDRSEKALSVIASGRWFLCPAFVDDSFEAGHFLNEEEYEWGNPKAKQQLPGDLDAETNKIVMVSHKWRKELQTRSKQEGRPIGMFSGFRSILHINKKDSCFKRLLEAGCGEVVDLKEPYSKQEDFAGVTHCFVDNRHNRESRLADDDKAAMINAGVNVVNVLYILACMQEDKRPPITDFAVK